MKKTEETIGERVKRLRKARNLTQSEVAKRAPLSLQMVKDIEAGRRKGTVETLSKFAKVFSVSLIEITNYSAPEKNVFELPTRAALKKALSIPDQVYDLAAKLGPDHPVWKEYVLPALEDAQERNGNNHSSKSV